VPSVAAGEVVVQRKFKLSARISSATPSAIKTVLQQFLSDKGSVKPADGGFEVEGELTGESARDLNRMLLSQMRRAERRTRLRSEWTADGVTERFFDYVPKGRKKTRIDSPA
jgi:hypothetical protein